MTVRMKEILHLPYLARYGDTMILHSMISSFATLNFLKTSGLSRNEKPMMRLPLFAIQMIAHRRPTL